MAGFRGFMAVWMLSIVSVSMLVLGMTAVLQSNRVTEVKQGHFSVVWRGFFPGYSTQYPDYYICINDLKSPLRMNIRLFIQNQEASGYYFKIEKYEEPLTGWSLYPYLIGYIDVDGTKDFVYSEIYRTKPSSIPAGRLTEKINLAVKAYYDADYTLLYSYANFTATFHLLDRTSPAWTIIDSDNFDDGTAQGWGGGSVTTQYYRSFRYSYGVGGNGEFSKSFFVPNTYSESYLIFPIRAASWSAYGETEILLNNVRYFSPDTTPGSNIWYQFAIPLPTMGSVSVIIRPHAYSAFIDDVYVIAK